MTPDIEKLIAEEHASLLSSQRAGAGAGGNGSKRGPVPPVSLDGLLMFTRDCPPQSFVVDDLLPRGLTIAAGRPKVGKSWLALQLALAVAFGEKALRRFNVSVPGRVMYIALEDSQRRVHDRLHDLLSEPDPRLKNILFYYQLLPLMTGGALQLDAMLAANPSELVIIDTLLAAIAAHSGRRDVVRGDYAEVNVLRELTEKHNTTMLCIAHARKAAGDLMDTVLGTSGTTAACDSVWSMKRQNTGEAVLEIRGRDIEDQLYALTFNKDDPYGWMVTGQGPDSGMSEERKDIILLLEQEGAMKPAQIARALVKNAVTVRRLVQKLAFDGFIRRQSNGTYVPVPNEEQRNVRERP